MSNLDNYGEAQKILAGLTTKEQAESDPSIGTKVFLLLHTAHDAGDLRATAELAEYYLRGWWVNKNVQESDKFIQKLEEQGEVDTVKRLREKVQNLLDRSKFHRVYQISDRYNDGEITLEQAINNLLSLDNFESGEAGKVYSVLIQYLERGVTEQSGLICLYLAKLVHDGYHIGMLGHLQNYFRSNIELRSLLDVSIAQSVPGANAFDIWLKIKNKVDSSGIPLSALIIEMETLAKNGDMFARQYIGALRKL